jgi:hypothetical protein
MKASACHGRLRDAAESGWKQRSFSLPPVCKLFRRLTKQMSRLVLPDLADRRRQPSRACRTLSLRGSPSLLRMTGPLGPMNKVVMNGSSR